MARYRFRTRDEFLTSLPFLQAEDSAEIPCFETAAGSMKDFCSLLLQLSGRQITLVSDAEGLDTSSHEGQWFLAMCSALLKLNETESKENRRAGIEKARREGKYRGRKPIAIDRQEFDAVVSLWQKGEITARQAMSRLELKPNTFYRRLKEREEEKMKDYKEAGKAIREELRDAAKEGRKELHDLHEQVKAEAKEFKKNADETLSLHEVEREIRKDRIHAEFEHQSEVKQIKKEVAEEAKEFKKLLDNSPDIKSC